MKSTLLLTAAALCLGPSAAFTNICPDARPTTSLSMSKNDRGNNGKTFAASTLAAAYILGGVLSADAAFAMDDPTVPSFADSSSVVLAGRSGGRAGGRSAPRAMPRRASAPSTTTKVYNTRTVIQAPPVVMGGGYGGYGGYGYGGGYGGGLGLNLGLMGINSIGNGMREGRQNQELATDRAELGAAKEREAELAMRVRQLEMMQMQQAGGGGGQAQPQVIYAQPPVQQLAQPPVQQQLAPAQ